MINTIKFIYTHPLNKDNKIKAILRFIKWQISSRLWNSFFIYNWIGSSRLVIAKGMTGATGNIYVGLMEYEDMSFLLYYLQKDDLFYDIGANVGVYTVLTSQVKEVKTVSIEPLPLTYEKLLDNININRLTNVISKNIGLSFEPSKLYFTTTRDTMNSVALKSDLNTQEVIVDTLDNISHEHGVPNAIKIDVEGYESNVLNGAKEVPRDDRLEVIILELNGSGQKFGFLDDDIHNDLLEIGFSPYAYEPFNRKLTLLKSYGLHNTIYIKKQYLEKITTIIENSEKFSCNGIEI
jgi:FkbM family methyltransferase